MADEQRGQRVPPPADRPKPDDDLPLKPDDDPKPAGDPLPATPPRAQPIQPVEDVGYTARGVPTFDSVREKIETRFGTALGAHELAADTAEGRSAEEQYEARQKTAAERLEQIRSSMHPDPDEEG